MLTLGRFYEVPLLDLEGEEPPLRCTSLTTRVEFFLFHLPGKKRERDKKETILITLHTYIYIYMYIES